MTITKMKAVFCSFVKIVFQIVQVRLRDCYGVKIYIFFVVRIEFLSIMVVISTKFVEVMGEGDASLPPCPITSTNFIDITLHYG